MARHVSDNASRAREFEAYVAGAGSRLLHTATLLTAETPDANPRARRLLTHALAHTYACWDRLHGEDPYDHTRQYLATRFANSAWHELGGLLRSRPRPGGPLATLPPQERLVLVLRLHEGVAEEQTAALLGLPAERIRTIFNRAMANVLSPPRRPAPTVAGVGAVPS
ncbi:MULTISPECIES: sigma factor-like helix-turn-helix DNA-binding protein [unclassified Streptomyces]|uniref:sigma factor-like helix-turn-helix DNA-binding protein n=1 Tax=unclassified Streptomyces TaxID=2593676 RepID=UPI000F6D5275|nr:MULTISPECIES: sigma factor-like helix-turn-helix DNA-binding protein [unclassified Streptomyces]AZM60350.1 RNA polymerase subunit sigma-70 [Streptomyces sp. WAC 01438]RSM92701.1 RNA polymerase subunit sigma-70 [Streptomyces sp. WAC 01420]